VPELPPVDDAPIKPTEWMDDEEHLREEQDLKIRTDAQRQSWFRKFIGW
jgi:hypothetical protein